MNRTSITMSLLFCAACAGGDTVPGGITDTIGGSASSGSDPSSGEEAGSSAEEGSSTGSSGAPTTGTGDETGSAVCGDGSVGGDEECDDGNDVNADGCNVGCVPSGTLLWEHTHAGGVGANELAFGVAADADGFAYVAGMVGNATGTDFFIRKYEDPAAQVWTRTIDRDDDDRAHGLAVGEGVVWVVGSHLTPSAARNWWIGRLDDEGNVELDQTVDGGISSNDELFGVALNGVGQPIVAGYVTVSGQGNDLRVRQYNESLSQQWEYAYNGPQNAADRALAIDVDSSDNVAVAGYTTTATQRDVFVTKLDAGGSQQWPLTTHDGTDSLDDEAAGVAFDPSTGDVVVTGREGRSEATWALWVRKYDTNGAEIWTDTWTGAQNEGARGSAVAVDDTGNIVVSGYQLRGGVQRIFVRKYDADGTVLWTTEVVGSEVGNHQGLGVAVGPERSVFASGGLDLGVDERDLWVGRFAE